MSTSRTAERPPSVAPAIANRRTSLSLAEVAPARQGGFGSSGSDPIFFNKTQPGALCACRQCSRADVLHPESKQQTTPARPRDALECVAALARTRECRQDCVRFAYRGPQVDRLHVLELKRDVE